jgi:hypothetical protein
MDADGFREPQSPWFFTQPPQYLVETRVNKVAIPRKDTAPTQDNRFPGWAAPMSDGRLVTDYRSHCAVNLPTGTQYASKQFMIHNTDSIISQSRKRTAERTGAGLSFDSRTEMPAEQYVKCDINQCTVTNNVANGVGLERLDSVPSLFGTFAYSSPSFLTPATPAITTKFEGGRNTIRGNF